MIDNIRDEFIDLVEQSTWMDADSKAKAIEKVGYKLKLVFIFL